jgi:hypothetical protein
MAITIEAPQGMDALGEFIQFHDRVYRDRAVRWSAPRTFQLPVLLGKSPFAEGRTMRPLVARQGGAIVARALAVVDHRHNRHWNERVGHFSMFEALPDARAATRRLVDEACAWLESQSADSVRAGFGVLEFPFVIDDYESLPPSVLRQNPPYYHALLKDAGFESERGWVDYKIDVRPELLARWESALEAVRRAGYEIVPLRDVPVEERTRAFTEIWNDAFKAHWGHSPFSEAEIGLLFGSFAPASMLETSVFARDASGPVGVLWVTAENSGAAVCRPGRTVRDSEKLNFLGIGVRESARGRGVNLGMASYAFLDLVRRGASYLSYTLVLDDNWPSRRTGEKLGGYVCANYLTYRRDLRRSR